METKVNIFKKQHLCQGRVESWVRCLKPLSVREPMNPSYFETHFRLETPISDWPCEFVIITAHATTGESWTAGNADSPLRTWR